MMASVFISKSRGHATTWIDCLERETINLGVRYEDQFRPYQATTSYHEAWCDQLSHYREADAMLVFITGEESDSESFVAGLSQGMATEVWDAMWKGMPIVWCPLGESPAAAQTARNHAERLRSMHPTLLTYLMEQSLPTRAWARAIEHLITCNLAGYRLPDLPTHFEPGRRNVLELDIVRPGATGTDQSAILSADLTSGYWRPVLRCHYGSHVLRSPFRDGPRCPSQHHLFDGEIVDPSKGRIRINWTLPDSGCGQYLLEWKGPEDGDPSDQPAELRSELEGHVTYHWDFVCGGYQFA